MEGTGSAIISNISVKLLLNQDIFQDIYPDCEDDSSGSEGSDVDDDGHKKKDSPELKAVRAKLTALRDEQKRFKEAIASAESRLKILDKYSNQTALYEEKNPDIAAEMDTYRSERNKVFEAHMEGSQALREVGERIADELAEEGRLLRIERKLAAREEKKKAKEEKARRKEQEKKRLREEKRQKEKARIRAERERFWPRSCYSLTVTLDATSFTPVSSRRSSVASSSDLVKVSMEKEAAPGAGDSEGRTTPCDLTLSYVTSAAFWSPSYDLALSTTANTALLYFDAQLTNTTSETWSNCSITLSTSQTTFGGLNDTIPTLVPWHVKLAPKGQGPFANDILDSNEERSHKDNWQYRQNAPAWEKPRGSLFGVDETTTARLFVTDASRVYDVKTSGFGSIANTNSQNRAGGLFGNTNNAHEPSAFGAAQSAAGGVFGQRSDEQNRAPAAAAALYRPAPKNASPVFASMAAPIQQQSSERSEAIDEDEAGAPAGASLDDDATMLPEPQPQLDFQESSFEETGLTTTYDLPGTKTLAPSSTSSKQRVARLSFAKVAFSHTVVAKYRPAAYLKAKLRNDSKFTLLKGLAGLTLDGSFMGRTTLPRCSAGGAFAMSLGVDPAIRIAYPKPEVRRSTAGFLSKENSSAYTRTVTISNTRAAAGRPVSLTVLDQVPVSQDEKLRVEIATPRGLVLEGAGVAAGVAVKEGRGRGDSSGKDDQGWGRATAQLKKGGQVCWDVTLNAGNGVKLVLEYDVTLPAGEAVVQCSSQERNKGAIYH